MLIKQIIKFKLRGPGPPARTYTTKLVIFRAKQKSFREDHSVDYYLLLQYCRKQCILLPSTRAKSLAKFNTKMQDFERVVDLNCK